MAGGCVVLAHDPSATICFPLIERHQINVTSLVPPAVSLWLQAIADGAGNAQLKSLKLLQVGAHASPPRLPRVFRRKLAASYSRCSAWRKGW